MIAQGEIVSAASSSHTASQGPDTQRDLRALPRNRVCRFECKLLDARRGAEPHTR